MMRGGGQVGEHGVGHVRVAQHVVDLEPLGLVLQHQAFVHGREHQRMRAARQVVGEDDGRPRDHLAEDVLISAMRDHGEAARHGCPQAGGVVEVMVRDDQLR